MGNNDEYSYIWRQNTNIIDMEAWIVWIVVAVLLIAVEVMTQWMWTLCLAIGSLCGLVASLLGLNEPVQIAICAVVGVIAYFVCAPFAQRWYEKSWKGLKRADRTGMDALLGRKAIVTEEIRPGELGRARIDGDYWQVRAPGIDYIVPRGAKVSVNEYDSIILTVEPYYSDADNETKTLKTK